MTQAAASFFIALVLSSFVLFGIFEAMSTPHLRWYKRVIIVFLWPILYMAAWLDKREY